MLWKSATGSLRLPGKYPSRKRRPTELCTVSLLTYKFINVIFHIRFLLEGSPTEKFTYIKLSNVND
jgi:hypothetical protein